MRRVYLLLEESKQQQWQTGYEQTYIDQMEKQGVPFTTVSVPEAIDYEHLCMQLRDNVESGSVIWPMHYKRLNTELRKAADATKSKIIFRISGTASNPECYQVDLETEADIYNNICDVNMSYNPNMTNFLKRNYPSARFDSIGYPVTVDTSIKCSKRTPMIVIAGRLSPDKQPLLAMRMLRPYVYEYDVVFCYPDNGGKDTAWMESIGGFKRYESKGFHFLKKDRANWLKTAGHAEFYFSCSLGDTACVSMIEAINLGCYALTPDFGSKELPCYHTNVNTHYEPFSYSSLDRLIQEKPPQTVNNEWSCPDKWGVRFKAMLETL